MNVAVTGHRPNKLGNDYALTSPLILRIGEEIKTVLNLQSPNRCISGMALGVDTLFANISLDLGIPLTAAIPCTQQESRWPWQSRKVYKGILAHDLTTTHYATSGGYTSVCMQLRNEWMVDNCGLLIAVWDGTSGGTANCVKYAKKKGTPVYVIDPSVLK